MDRFARHDTKRFLCHSWCSTPVGVMDRFASRSPSWAASTASAQRLSASWIGSPGRCGVMPSPSTVLNACRRHGSVRGRHVFGSDRESNVLNACRRHGSVRACARIWITSSAAVLNACRRHGSVRRLRALTLSLHLLVLNACRRHGSVRDSYQKQLLGG